MFSGTILKIERLCACNPTVLCVLQSSQQSHAALREVALERSSLQESIRENELEGIKLKAAVQANEAEKRKIQATINSAMASNANSSFLGMLSQFRIQAVQLQELQFQVCVSACECFFTSPCASG